VFALKSSLIHKWTKGQDDGFTLVEVLMAGVLLAFLMSGISRLSISALASSSNQSARTRIEAAINYDIQLLQMQDSYLRLEDIDGQEEQDSACKNSAEYLKQHLSSKVELEQPKRVTSPTGIDQPLTREFEVLEEDDMDILIVRYKFYAPEYTGKPDAIDHWEFRSIELNPNFTSKCYTTRN